MKFSVTRKHVMGTGVCVPVHYNEQHGVALRHAALSFDHLIKVGETLTGPEFAQRIREHSSPQNQ